MTHQRLRLVRPRHLLLHGACAGLGVRRPPVLTASVERAFSKLHHTAGDRRRVRLGEAMTRNELRIRQHSSDVRRLQSEATQSKEVAPRLLLALLAEEAKAQNRLVPAPVGANRNQKLQAVTTKVPTRISSFFQPVLKASAVAAPAPAPSSLAPASLVPPPSPSPPAAL